jgi:preprotein translocase subunit SecD
MKKRKLITSALIGFVILLSFTFSSQALAKLTILYPQPGQTAETELILSPALGAEFSETQVGLQLLDAEQVIARRLAQLGLPQSYTVARRDGQLVVTLPARSGTPYVNSVISHVGDIEFIDGGASPPSIGQQVQTSAVESPEANTYHTLFRGEEVTRILPPSSEFGQIFHQISLEPAASARFAAFTQASAGHSLCIVMDQEVISCSAMYSWENDTLEILPNLSTGSLVSLADLAIFLESGPLPFPLKLQTNL